MGGLLGGIITVKLGLDWKKDGGMSSVHVCYSIYSSPTHLIEKMKHPRIMMISPTNTSGMEIVPIKAPSLERDMHIYYY